MERLLGPKTVELMSSVFAPDSLAGRQPGRSFGLSVQVITIPWRGYRSPRQFRMGRRFWHALLGRPQRKVVGIPMIQTDNPNRQLDRDFENAVMQAIVD
jgi:hypothetical protein